MFFILRCIFWLSLVFAHLPESAGGRDAAGQFLELAGRHVDAFARQSAQGAAGQGADWCRGHGEACANVILATMRAKAPGALAPGSSSSASQRSDTLTMQDRAVGALLGKVRG